MADIRPFRGLIYDTETSGDIKDVVAPPYDIISPGEQHELLVASPYNIVRLILPQDPSLPAGAWQEQAHLQFEEWKQAGVFRNGPAESIYFYRQTFTLPDSSRLSRTAFISLYKLEDLGRGGIYPHERTFPLVTREQLALLRSCSASFSQIFTLFEDDPRYHAFLDERALPASRMLFSFEDKRGLVHELMELNDPTLLDELKTYMRDRRIFIADGHHRYETSLLYRDERRSETGSAGDTEEPWDFISMAFIGLNDPGLVLLPVHRLLRCEALAARDVVAGLEPFCEMRAVEGPDRDSKVREAWRLVLDNSEPLPLFGLVTAEEVFLFSPRGLREALAELAREHPREWAELDVTVLHEVVLKRFLGLGNANTDAGAVPHEIRYTVYLDEVIAASAASADGGGEYGFLVRSPSLQAAWKIAELGDKMPHKSTYFYPKMPSGLVAYDHASS
jgi:uncharacterized protein (DUF1015 family)